MNYYVITTALVLDKSFHSRRLWEDFSEDRDRY